MSSAQFYKRYRVNPVEIVVLAVVGTIFLKSVYDLFQHRSNLQFTSLSPMSARPTYKPGSTFSVTDHSFKLNVGCDTMQDQNTGAAKVRLTGSFCKSGPKLLESQIQNSTAQYRATVFSESNGSAYSTDYIPLLPGKNLIQVEFRYQNTRYFQEFNIYHTPGRQPAQQSEVETK